MTAHIENLDIPAGMEITGELPDGAEKVLTPKALELIVDLHRKFNGERLARLEARKERQAEIAAGKDLDFLPETAEIRNDPSWQVAPPAPGLEDRRVEMTGPTYKKMTINALNSGAKVWLADQEDANTPQWDSVIQRPDQPARFAQPRDRLHFARGQVLHPGPRGGAADHRRPPPWLAPATEKHIRIDGEETSGSLVDFALYFSTAGQIQIEKGKGPYFYLPKMESHLEARLWNQVFEVAAGHARPAPGTIRATVLIETYPAAFEMEEILYELREHSAGLNAGRWDYIFSVIKNFRTRGDDSCCRTART